MINLTNIRTPIPNMMRLFKRRLPSASQIQSLLENIGDNERNLGTLPYDWFEKTFSDEERSIFASKTFDIFANFAKGVRSACYVPIQRQKIMMLQKFLSEHVDRKASVQYLSEGAIGKTLKIKIKGKEYVLKIFHDVMGLDLDHGKSIEIINAISYNHAKKSSQRARFFFGRIAREQDKDGFMITEFVPQGKGKEVAEPSLLDYRRFKFVDNRKSNVINGKIVDFGAIYLNYSNKKEEQIAREILPLLKKGDENKLLETIKKYRSEPELETFIARLSEENNSPVLNYNGKFLETQKEKIKILEKIIH